MPDREKIIKALECCRRGFCFACPYNDGIYETTDCKQRWADDAIALLKERESIEPKNVNRYIDFDGEGQAYIPETYDCGACGNELPWKASYCPACGRKVKWE